MAKLKMPEIDKKKTKQRIEENKHRKEAKKRKMRGNRNTHSRNNNQTVLSHFGYTPAGNRLKQKTTGTIIQLYSQVIANLNHFAHRHMNCVFDEKSISPTLTTMQGGNLQPKVLIKNPPKGVSTIELNGNTYGVRKLTPKECWRLMGFSDSQFEKAESVCSNTQLYKQAGNSIVIPVMSYIFKNLFK